MKLAFFLLFSQVAVLVQFLQLHLRDVGFGDADIGLLMGLLQVSGIAGTFLVAGIVDRKPITRVLLAASIAGSGLLFLALTSARELPVAIALSIGLGLLYRSEVPLLDAHVSLALSETGHDYGKIRAWGTIGFVVASLVFQFAGYPRPDIDGSITTMFLAVSGAFLASTLLLPRNRNVARRVSATARSPLPARFWHLIAIAFLVNSGFAVHVSFFSLYVQESLQGFLVSAAWAVGTAAEIPAVLAGSWAVRRFGVRALLVSAVAAMALRLVIYAAMPQILPVMAAQLLHAFTFGALHIGSMYAITRMTEQASRGRAVALYYAIGYGVPGLLGGIVGGQILERWGFSALFAGFAVLPAAGILVAARFRPPQPSSARISV